MAEEIRGPRADVVTTSLPDRGVSPKAVTCAVDPLAKM